VLLALATMMPINLKSNELLESNGARSLSRKHSVKAWESKGN
jgi:hypothetical protein